MSIFKETFKDFVQKQIEKRQEKVGKNDRTPFLQRQCTIRLASAVNVNGSPELAKKNVLQGGVLFPTMVEATETENETGTLEFALKRRGGFNGAYDSPSDGYGYVPMPGITSVNIKTKTAYGSLRGATINFECHSINQLSVLEQLYMRPGYPCLLEWGWLPFIDNEGNQQSQLPYLSDDGEFFSFPDLSWHTLQTGEKQQDAISRRIKEKKKKYNGNYDGLFGIVKNFNYSVRPDGGFTCMTELVALGEVLDSLKGMISEEDPTKHHIEDILLKFNDYSTTLVRGDLADEREFSGEKGGLILDKKRLDESRELEKYFRNKNIDFLINNENPEYDKNGADIYINWETLVRIINDSINKDDDNLPLVEIITTNEGKELEFNENKLSKDIEDILDIPSGYGFPLKLDISVNPKICIFPSQVYDIFGQEQANNRVNVLENPNRVAPFNKFTDPKQDQLTSTVADKTLNTTRNIKDIYFNVPYLYKIFKSQFYSKDEDDNEIENEDFSLGKYIKTIWDDVNLASGNGHNFQLITDFDNSRKCKIIDLEIKETPSLDNLVELNTLSTGSIVRDFNYDLTVPSSLTSTIAIAAQNPDNPGDLNQVTFAAFNKNIRNRFITNNGINGKKGSLNNRKKYYTHLKVLSTPPPGDSGVDGVSGAAVSMPDTNNINYLQDEVYTLNDLLIELRIYLERLKGYRIYRLEDKTVEVPVRGWEMSIDYGDELVRYIVETELLKKANEWNKYEDKQLEDNEDYKVQKWKLAGEAFIDFGEIPSTLITSARTTLKKILTIKNNLSKYTLPSRSNINNKVGTEITNPDITSVIPIKFNIKLDGISGIVIGNVFKLSKSRLPKSYNDANIAFVVFGEEQTIDNQDWTTTITGQVILLS